jgi:Ni,Fe-hydrogenase maturation factor
MEIWKQIINCPKYEVSNLGNFRNINIKKNLKKRFIKNNGSESYVIYLRNKKDNRQPIMAARTVAMYFCDNPDNYKHFIYIDKVKTNIKSDNLRWVKYTDSPQYKSLIENRCDVDMKMLWDAHKINIPTLKIIGIIMKTSLSDDYKNILYDFILDRNNGAENFYNFFKTIVNKDDIYLSAHCPKMWKRYCKLPFFSGHSILEFQKYIFFI